MKTISLVLSITLLFLSCTGSEQAKKNQQKEKDMVTDSTKQYAYNRNFLKQYTDIIELRNNRSALVLIPAWQGRVMTSSAEGDTGFSFGWINHKLIASGEIQPHINAFGGEERLWLGPEGGQFSIFFSKGKSFTFDDWQTPAFLDTTPFRLVASTDTSAKLENEVEIENFSGTKFSIKLERAVTLLSDKEILEQIGIDPGALNCVAYKSENNITNKGLNVWTKESGLLSIWMLGMFNPSPSIVVVIPVKHGDEKIIGPRVNDNYFGKIPAERLKVDGDHIYFRADGKSRGKIGIPPARATGTMGSYDSENKILTLLICRLPEGKTDYVNSAWEIQKQPFSGDALNSYNDGPLDDGSQMGPFYELETSSPAADLKPGESLSHIQYTLHLKGDTTELDKVSRDILGVSLEEIKNAFNR
jgi:hypothetical protein